MRIALDFPLLNLRAQVIIMDTRRQFPELSFTIISPSMALREHILIVTSEAEARQQVSVPQLLLLKNFPLPLY